MKKYLPLFAVVLLAGCASVTGDPIFMLPPGSEVRLNQDIRTEQGERIYIQAGRVRPQASIDIHEPHCQFHVERSQQEIREPLVIEKDVFVVTRSFQQSDYASAEGVQFAQMDSNRSLSTVMELAPVQGFPEIEFICSRWGSKSRDGFVQLHQMQETLMTVVELKVVR